MIINESYSIIDTPPSANKLANGIGTKVTSCDISEHGTVGIHTENGKTITVYANGKVSKPYKDDEIVDLLNVGFSGKILYKNFNVKLEDVIDDVISKLNKELKGEN